MWEKVSSLVSTLTCGGIVTARYAAAYLVLGVEQDFEDLGAVHFAPGALADDFRGVHEVFEDGVLDVRQGAGARPGAFVLAGPRVVLSEDRTVRDHDHVPSGKLLLELAHESGLDFVEQPQLAERHEDHDRLLAPADVHFFRTQKLQVTKIALQLRARQLQILHLLVHLLLQLRTTALRRALRQQLRRRRRHPLCVCWTTTATPFSDALSPPAFGRTDERTDGWTAVGLRAHLNQQKRAVAALMHLAHPSSAVLCEREAGATRHEHRRILSSAVPGYLLAKESWGSSVSLDRVLSMALLSLSTHIGFLHAPCKLISVSCSLEKNHQHNQQRCVLFAQRRWCSTVTKRCGEHGATCAVASRDVVTNLPAYQRSRRRFPPRSPVSPARAAATLGALHPIRSLLRAAFLVSRRT